MTSCFIQGKTRPKIAITLFGITRSLDFTIGTIDDNVISAAHALGDVRIFAHFWDEKHISNPRTGESGDLAAEASSLIQADQCLIEDPDDAEVARLIQLLRRNPDLHDDGYRSLRNLAYQLVSIDRACNLTKAWEPDITVFIRPDLAYHDTFMPALEQALKRSKDCIMLPSWQAHGGYNDRYAICVGTRARAAWGNRVHHVDRYLAKGYPMNAERYLRYHLRRSGVGVLHVPMRATRIRFGGEVQIEDFVDYRIRFWAKKWRKAKGRSRDGLRVVARSIGMPVERMSLYRWRQGGPLIAPRGSDEIASRPAPSSTPSRSRS
mgnify:CR=1 FL=1